MRTFSATFLIPLVLLISCSTKKENVSQAITADEKSVFFKLDETISKESNCLQYFYDGERPYLTLLNLPTREIIFFDYNTGQVAHRIVLKKDGPDGVGNVYGYHIKSMDSIFVLANRSYKLSLINGDGQLLKSFLLLEKGFDSNGMPASEETIQPLIQSTSPLIVLSDSVIVVSGVPDKNPTSPQFYNGSSCYIRLNIENGRFAYAMPYPQEYLDNTWGLYDQFPSHVFVREKSRAIVSFPIVGRLYETDFKEAITTHEASAPSIEKPKPWENPDLDGLAIVRRFMESPSYYRIVYNEADRVYYRFYQQPTEIDYAGISLETFSPFANKKTYINILDENFSSIGEVELPRGLNPRFLFINEKGIHMYYENNNEDLLEFKILKFTHVE